jgi:hypothetical protein
MVVEPSLVNTVFFPQKYMNDPIFHRIVLCYLFTNTCYCFSRAKGTASLETSLTCVLIETE